MGRSGKDFNTKLPFGFMGQPLGGLWFALIMLILTAAFVSFLFWFFAADSPTTQCLYCDDSLTVPSKAFHNTNTDTQRREGGFAVPLSLKITASSTANFFEVETLTPIRKLECAVGFT